LSLIVALDFPELEPCRKLLSELGDLVKIYKIGTELFTAHGWEAVELVHQAGAKVFLDLKLHDIPTTVAKTARVIARRGIFMFNVHTLGGLQMMRETRRAVDEECKTGKKPLLLGVTILTSHEEKALERELGIKRPLKEEVMSLARLAREAGLDGVIASPGEAELLRKELGKGFLLVTPGIRPAESAQDDQKRALTPQEALRRGADYLVVGRPITGASDPRQAVQHILQSLS
jgi:orotidine-5'-phosphate decarboxylase